MACTNGSERISGVDNSLIITKANLCSIFGATGIVCKALNVLDGNFSTPIDDTMTDAMRAYLQGRVSEVAIEDIAEFNDSFSTTPFVPTFALCALSPELPPDITFADVLVSFTGIFATSLLQKLARYQLYINWFNLCQCKNVKTNTPLQPNSPNQPPPLPPLPCPGSIFGSLIASTLGGRVAALAEYNDAIANLAPAPEGFHYIEITYDSGQASPDYVGDAGRLYVEGCNNCNEIGGFINSQALYTVGYTSRAFYNFLDGQDVPDIGDSPMLSVFSNIYFAVQVNTKQCPPAPINNPLPPTDTDPFNGIDTNDFCNQGGTAIPVETFLDCDSTEFYNRELLGSNIAFCDLFPLYPECATCDFTLDTETVTVTTFVVGNCGATETYDVELYFEALPVLTCEEIYNLVITQGTGDGYFYPIDYFQFAKDSYIQLAQFIVDYPDCLEIESSYDTAYYYNAKTISQIAQEKWDNFQDCLEVDTAWTQYQGQYYFDVNGDTEQLFKSAYLLAGSC